MASHVYTLQTVEYDDVKLEAVFVLSQHRHLPLPEGAREDLTSISFGEIRVGPIKTTKAAIPPITASWVDPETWVRYTATWNSTTKTWSAPVVQSDTNPAT